MANDKLRFKLRGIAIYPKTDRPFRWDEAAGRSVADPEGTYELTVAVPEATAKDVRAKLLKFGKDGGLKGTPKVSMKPQTDRETGENTGLIEIKLKQYGQDKSGDQRKIAHYDGKAKPLPAGFRLTSGSEIIVDCYPTIYKAQGGGIKLNIGSIQVIKYVEPQAYNPFEAVDDGYDSAGDTDTDESAEDAPFDNEEVNEEAEATDF